MTLRPLLAATAVAASCCAGAQAADLRLTFDLDAQGVTAIDGSLSHDPGGFLLLQDTTDADMTLILPAAVLGDWSAFLGGTFAFDARNANGDSADYLGFGIVTLTNAGIGKTVQLDVAPALGVPTASWATYGASLDAAAWGTDLPAVLANVTSVSIDLEFHNGVTEVAGFDNLSVTAVPEPASAALWLAGLALLAAGAGRGASTRRAAGQA